MHQKIALIILLFFLSFFAKAQGGELSPETINALKQLACYVDDKTTTEVCGVSKLSCFGESPNLLDYEALESTEDYEACVKSICGHNNPNIHDYADAVDIQTEMNLAKVKETFDPKLDSLFQNMVSMAQSSQQHLAQNPELKRKLDDEVSFSNIIAGYRQIFMMNGANEIPEARRPGFGASHFGWDPNLTKLIGDYMKESAAVVENINQEEVLKSLMNSVQERTRLMGDLERRIRELPDHNMRKTLLRQQIHSLQSSSFISESGNTAYLQNIVGLLLNVEMEEFDSKNPRGVAYKQNIVARIPVSERQQFQIYTGLENEQDYFKQACNINISKTAMLLPKEQELNVIKGKAEATRAKILQSIQGKFSNETLGIMIPTIQNTNIILPPTRESFLSRMEGFIAEQRGMFNSFNEAEKATWSGFATNHAGMQIADSLCTQSLEIIPNAFAWSTRTSHNHNHDHRNNVSLGAPFANNYEVFGERALAHEFGHIVSYLVQDFGSNHSKNGMKAAKDCLVSNHTGKWFGGLFAFLKQESEAIRIKEEEDYADLFSFMTVPNQTPKMCGLFDEGISIMEGENHLDATRMKLHSPTFFRLLHENTFLGNEMPQVCKNELREKREFPDFKNCWKRPAANTPIPGKNR